MIEQEAELGPGLLESVWRYKWIVAAVLVVGTAAGYLYASQQSELYRASARLLLEDPRSRIVLSESRDYFVDASRYVRNQAQVVTSEAVLRRAARSLNVPEGSLAVGADPLLDIDAIDISAVHSDPEQAAAIVDAVGAAYEVVMRQQTRVAGEAAIEELETARDEVEQQLADIERSRTVAPDDPALSAERDAAVEQLQTLATRIRQLSVDTALAGSGVKLREQAFVPASPYRPRPARTAGATGMLAFLAASAAAWWWNTRKSRVVHSQDVDAILGAPRLGEIPPFDPSLAPVPAASDPRSPAAEAYQFLHAALDLPLARAGIRSLLVTSARQGEGKTVTALNLAVGADRSGTHVVVIDADARLRSLTRAAGADITVGLPQLATDAVPLEWALAKTDVGGVDRLRLIGMISDEPLPNPAEFFRSEHFTAALRRLSEEFELVVIDTPPLLAVADASAIASAADGVLLVVDPDTPAEALTEVRRRLDLNNANLVGYVMNRTDVDLSPYSYGQGYEMDAAQPGAGSEAVDQAPAAATPSTPSRSGPN